MILFMWRFTCECGNHFEAPQIDEYNYGEFLLRNDFDELRCVYGPNDAAFAEVIKLVDSNEKVMRLRERDQSKIAQYVFSITCDTDAVGGPFEMNCFQKCPKCGSRKMKTWGQIYPFKPFEVDIQTVTHNHWNTLTLEEKKTLVDQDVVKRLEQLGKP